MILNCVRNEKQQKQEFPTLLKKQHITDQAVQSWTNRNFQNLSHQFANDTYILPETLKTGWYVWSTTIYKIHLDFLITQKSTVSLVETKHRQNFSKFQTLSLSLVMFLKATIPTFFISHLISASHEYPSRFANIACRSVISFKVLYLSSSLSLSWQKIRPPIH